MKLYLFGLVLFLFIFDGSAKFMSGKISIHNKEWEYLSKFVVGPSKNEGQFRVEMQFNKVLAISKSNVEASFLVYEENQWNQASKLKDCKEKKSLAQFDFPIQLPLDGAWSNSIEGTLGKQSQIQVWYFVISDCERNLKPYLVGKGLTWQLEVLNSNGSHFGEDESGVMLPLVIVTVVMAVFFVMNSVKFYKFYKSEESMDYPTLITTIAMFIEFLSLLCEITHLKSFAGDGVGYFALDFGNRALSILSQATISCLLLLLASGWSINTIQFQNVDTVPLVVFLFVSHLLLVILGITSEGAHYKFHDYENWSGIILIVYKILLLVLFCYLLLNTYRISTSEKQGFFKSFGVLSAIYFLTFPCLVGGASLFLPAYMRHKVVSGGTIILQTLTLLFFTVLFTSKTTQYYKVSFKGRALLPENKLH